MNNPLENWREREWLRRACFQFNRDPFGILKDERSFMQFTQQSVLLGGGGSGFSLYYTGSTTGMWTGQGVLPFSFILGGTWTFMVTAPVTVLVKACGPGGYGGYKLDPSIPVGLPVPQVPTYSYPCGGGGGGAYTLGTVMRLIPNVTYGVMTSGQGSQQPTRLSYNGVSIYELGGGMNGGGTGEHTGSQSHWNGGLGGTSIAPDALPGGYGGTLLSSTGKSQAQTTTGTGGGGTGGQGNNGCTGAWQGQPGGNGESAGVAGEMPSGDGCNGGDGGYGGGIALQGLFYGRGGGGGAEGGSWEFDLTPTKKDPLYVYAATGGLFALTYLGL